MVNLVIATKAIFCWHSFKFLTKKALILNHLIWIYCNIELINFIDTKKITLVCVHIIMALLLLLTIFSLMNTNPYAVSLNKMDI
ncbi:hypothetical protein GALL_458030 [mine drainage metagenome]|uniref:Uncharacterized protein n=1 Tax=mine drainage metagenome TaxID=410659 RepID=A0A1J5PN54_9ZZZZ